MPQMKRPKAKPRSLASLALILTLLLGACATRASNLKPDRVGKNDGAILGRMIVLNGTEDITRRCYAEFTDSEGAQKLYLQLASDGWVFTSLGRGQTYLSRVTCNAEKATARVLEYRGRELRFPVPGEGRISYFGHIAIQMKTDASVPQAELFNRMDNALAEYRTRYGAAADRLTAVTEVPPWGDRARTPASP